MRVFVPKPLRTFGRHALILTLGIPKSRRIGIDDANRRFAMGSAISLRSDFDGAVLRLLARQTRDADQARRLLALASIYDGGSRADAARLGSVTVQIVRDWVVRFNARGADGLINGKAPGKPSRLNDDQRVALAQIIERGPTPYLDGVVRWRLCDLAQWI
jgi:transposase